MIIGNKKFKGKTYIMGILNVTPDSFSDGGVHASVDDALFAMEQMIMDGADIIDIGGESTRPGYTPVSASEEIERVCPTLRAIKDRFDIPISVDTQKPEVALEALKLGCDMINDVSGLQNDEMVRHILDYDAPCCVVNPNDTWDDMTSLVPQGLEQKVILDPGIGFGKTTEQSLDVMRHLDKICNMGYPILLGTSRKSFIGDVLGISEAKGRLYGTLATTAIAHRYGALFVRVHDVKANKEFLTMLDAMK